MRSLPGAPPRNCGRIPGTPCLLPEVFMRLVVVSVLLGISAASLGAQTAQRLGFTAGGFAPAFLSSYTDRIGGNAVVGDALQHFDERDYRDWMINPADAT